MAGWKGGGWMVQPGRAGGEAGAWPVLLGRIQVLVAGGKGQQRFAQGQRFQAITTRSRAGPPPASSIRGLPALAHGQYGTSRS